MKGYKRVHGLAHCQDCDWSEEGFMIFAFEAKKHHKKTGHEIALEIGLTRTIQRSDKFVELAESKPKGDEVKWVT